MIGTFNFSSMMFMGGAIPGFILLDDENKVDLIILNI
jgi:hypothetical protein